jgi:hypothetical protein
MRSSGMSNGTGSGKVFAGSVLVASMLQNPSAVPHLAQPSRTLAADGRRLNRLAAYRPAFSAGFDQLC